MLFVCPSPLFQQKRVLEDFACAAQEIVATILTALSELLGLDCGRSLLATHRREKPSTTAIGLLKYPAHQPGDPEAGHVAHTDVGSLTLLFADLPGLQLRHPSTEAWMHVEPLPGHAVVNVGDSLRFISKGVFQSCLHRVLPNTDASDARYSIAYFLRPEAGATFRDANVKMWSSIEWHNRKFESFQSKVAGHMRDILRGKGTNRISRGIHVSLPHNFTLRLNEYMTV